MDKVPQAVRDYLMEAHQLAAQVTLKTKIIKFFE